MSEYVLTVHNLKDVLAEFIEEEKLAVKDVAKVIGCPVPVIGRILCGITWPSDTTLKRSDTMIELGYNNYRCLSESQKEKLSEKVGAVSGAGVGVVASIGAVSAMGVAGVSGPGITSGLAAIGALVGGGMLSGVGVVAAIPLVTAVAGYGVMKLIRAQVGEHELKKECFEPRWERPVEEEIA